MQHEREKKINGNQGVTNTPGVLHTPLTVRSSSSNSRYMFVETGSFTEEDNVKEQPPRVQPAYRFDPPRNLVNSPRPQENSPSTLGSAYMFVSDEDDVQGNPIISQEDSGAAVEVISQPSEDHDIQDWDQINSPDRRETFGYQNNRMPDEPQDEFNIQNEQNVNGVDPVRRRQAMGEETIRKLFEQ